MKTKITAIVLLFTASTLLSQNITNTLGTSGTFKIKDNSTTFMTVNQSTGLVDLTKNLNLQNTSSSSVGVLNKGSLRFLHNFAPAGADGNNTFIGLNSGNFTMSGTDTLSSYNTGIGYLSLFSLSTGCYNTSIGSLSMPNNTTGYGNVGIGFQSLSSNSVGSSNTAVGYQSIFIGTGGDQNTAVGYQSMRGGGIENTAIGFQSLFSSNLSQFNTAVGYKSLFSNTSGQTNTSIGNIAGSNITTGSNNTCIGSGSQTSTATSNNQITLGNTSITSLRCAVTTITSLSDARDKKYINDLSLGIDFLMKLKPRLFNWDKREWYDNNISDGSKMQETPTAGFIAQELDSVQTSEKAEWLNLVLKDNPEKWEATPGNLFPIVVKAIQELKAENDRLKTEVEELKSVNQKVNELEKIISEMKQSTEIKAVEK